MDRPALKRLLEDIKAGKIACVVVYKVDRLSRSLLDFARMMEIFDHHNVSFVSVTQQFNTSTSMGRLILNVLLSFAQFEREMISERTSDKMSAARRKGKYVGGTPILGYNVDREETKLIVNKDEAVRVKAIFELYLDLGSLLAVVQELEKRGWTNKCWKTQKGPTRGGKYFTKTSLHKFLTNVTYIGKALHKGEVYNGQQPPLIDAKLWERVQSLLKRNARHGGAKAKNKTEALLKNLLHCAACNCSMSPTLSTARKNRRYRYYVCCSAQKRGWHTCPSKSIPAAQIEKFVVDQVRFIGKDPGLLRQTIESVAAQSKEKLMSLDSEARILSCELMKLPDQRGQLESTRERIRRAEQRLSQIADERLRIERTVITEEEIRQAAAAFSPVWDSLTPKEQHRLVDLIVQRVDYDGGSNKIVVTFHKTGIKSLASE